MTETKIMKRNLKNKENKFGIVKRLLYLYTVDAISETGGRETERESRLQPGLYSGKRICKGTKKKVNKQVA